MKCPRCGSTKVKILHLPVDEEEFLKCEECGYITVLTKIKISEEDEKENKTN